MKRATVHFDGGGQSPGPVAAACTVELSDGCFDQDVTRVDQGTHNTAEWHALILGLRMALKHGERHVVVKGDSMLVVKQINRDWKPKECGSAVSAGAGRGTVGALRDLARGVDSAQAGPALRRARTGAMSPRVLCVR